MGRNWIRSYTFTAGPAGGLGFSISDLHISFSCSKTEDSTLNNIKIDIWNLNKAHRKMLETKDCQVKLTAGYSGDEKEIFEGYITYGESAKDGADFKTSIECADGRVECRDTQVSTSFTSGVSSRDLFNDIASQMKLPISFGDDVTHIGFPQGYCFVGDAVDSLDKICESTGLSWSIQNGELQIKKSKGTMNKLAQLISDETGLVSVPKKLKQSSENSDSTEENGYEVTFFMNAGININDYVFLKSNEATGLFRVSEININGDNWSGDWVCKAKLLEDNSNPASNATNEAISSASEVASSANSTLRSILGSGG